MRRGAVLVMCILFWQAGSAGASEKNSPGFAALPALHAYAALRYRTELVERDGTAHRAAAHTARLRAGIATAPVMGLGLLLEATAVGALGARRASNATAFDARYPTVEDGQNLDITQAALRFRPRAALSVRVGRQRISHDGERFIGPVGFRQTQQTFDAASASLRGLAGWYLDYDYVWQVRRIVGRRASAHAFDSDSHLFHASYKGFGSWSLDSYAYLFDVEADTFDSATYGGRIRHDWRWAAARFSLAGEAAYQRPYREQSNRSSYRYIAVAGGMRINPWAFKLGVERLGGDGDGGFQTPFATLHKSQGLTDQFLVTPAGGVTDGYLKAEYKISGARLGGIIGGLFDPGSAAHLRLWGAAHEFRGRDIGVGLGREWDLAAAIRFSNATRISLQAARYKAKSFSRDTEKIWLTFEAEF